MRNILTVFTIISLTALCFAMLVMWSANTNHDRRQDRRLDALEDKTYFIEGN